MASGHPLFIDFFFITPCIYSAGFPHCTCATGCVADSEGIISKLVHVDRFLIHNENPRKFMKISHGAYAVCNHIEAQLDNNFKEHDKPTILCDWKINTHYRYI